MMCLHVWPHVNSDLILSFPQIPFPSWPAVTSGAIHVNASRLCEYVLFGALFFVFFFWGACIYVYLVLNIY